MNGATAATRWQKLCLDILKFSRQSLSLKQWRTRSAQPKSVIVPASRAFSTTPTYHGRPCGNYGAGATACSRYRTTSPTLPAIFIDEGHFVYAAVNYRVGGYFDGN
ncbi:hypothetical protein MRX96_028816 [Rhipicephalus microplus]